VIVDDFDVLGAFILPDEADAPLVIDPDAVLSRSVSEELFQVIPWITPAVHNGKR
jgi:hypothetical protein